MKIFPPSKNPPTVRRRVSLFDSFVRGDSVQNVFVRERFAGLSVLVDVVLQCRFLSGQEKTEVDVNFRVDAKLVAQNFLDVTEIAEPRHLCAERRILINRVAKSAVFRIGAARNAFELFVVEDFVIVISLPKIFSAPYTFAVCFCYNLSRDIKVISELTMPKTAYVEKIAVKTP